MSWPTYPSKENSYFGDGKTYGRELGRVSPEGNVYGQIRVVRDVVHRIWWTGERWQLVEVTGRAASLADLNARQRPFGEIREITLNGVWRQYYRDVNAWKPINWMWDIQDITEVPCPGLQVGEAHRVYQPGVPQMWNGFYWEQLKHSSFADDEPGRHLPPGFLQFLAPDARVVFVSNREITLEKVKGGAGQVWVHGEYIEAEAQTSVFNNLASLEWDSQANRVVAAHVEPETEYWIYLANHRDSAFIIDGLAADDTHQEAPAWNYQGKLFLSRSADVDGYLSSIGAGLLARLVGKVQTDGTEASRGGPYFIRELDISLISRTTSFPETFREFSDYVVEFVDEANLLMKRLDGTYGQIYVGGELYYLGVNYVINRESASVGWNDQAEERVSLITGAVAANQRYFIYLAARVDPLNFNEINPDTNRPWNATDTGSADHYDAALDMRLRPFLSTKTPDHGRLSEQWPGYYARHIGQVSTDANGRFINARDISAIRQPTLDPTYFDGLIEAQIEKISDTELRLTKRLATSGIINVAGEAIQTYERLDLEHVHKIQTTDVVQEYTEGNITNPLTALDQLQDHPGETVYLYIANSRQHWGDYATKPFFALTAPIQGYLSRNWPGNTARWLATVKMSNTGTFGQKFLIASVNPFVPVIDDESNSTNTVFSSAKIVQELAAMRALIDSFGLYELQKTNGLNVVLEFLDSTYIILKPAAGTTANIVFSDLSQIVLTDAGIAAAIQATPDVVSYVYLTPDGALVLSTAGPTAVYDNMQVALSNKGILVGWVTCGATANTMAGAWNVLSFWHEPVREWTLAIPPIAAIGTVMATYYEPRDWYTAVAVPGFLCLDRASVSMWLHGQTHGQTCGACMVLTSGAYLGSLCTPNDQFGQAHVDFGYGMAFTIANSDATTYAAIMAQFVIRHSCSMSATYTPQVGIKHESGPTALIITRMRIT